MMPSARGIQVCWVLAMLPLSLGAAAAQTAEPSLPMSAAHQAIVDSTAKAVWSERYWEELVVDYEASDSTRVVFHKPGRPFELVISVTNDSIPSAYYCESCLEYLQQELPISALDAIAIARDAGLVMGVRAWRVSRQWYYEDLQCMVWTVENTLGQSQETAWGRTFVIDASNGRVLRDHGWSQIFCFGPPIANPDK